jgi:hypothetical protein
MSHISGRWWGLIEKAFRTPNKHDQERISPQHIKLPKVQRKDRVLKSAREKCKVTFKAKY